MIVPLCFVFHLKSMKKLLDRNTFPSRLTTALISVVIPTWLRPNISSKFSICAHISRCSYVVPVFDLGEKPFRAMF